MEVIQMIGKRLKTHNDDRANEEMANWPGPCAR